MRELTYMLLTQEICYIGQDSIDQKKIIVQLLHLLNKFYDFTCSGGIVDWLCIPSS